MTRDLPPVLEEDEGGDTANGEATRQVLVLVGINLTDLECRGPALSRLFEHRRHHLAGTTPRCPEVDEDGQAALGRMSHERGTVQGDHVAAEKLRFALGTLRVLTHAGRRSAHD